MIGKIIDGRVRQKAQTLEEWNNSTLDSLDGEQLFIRSDVDDVVIGFKFGAKNKTFSELPFIDLTVKDKANPGIVFSGKPSGIYVPTASGNYDGLDVNLAQGYQVIYWDGSITQKVVYPIDYTTLVFGGVIDDSKDLSNPTEPIWYIAKAGEYNTVPPTSLGVDSILTWNGSEWSHIPFELEVRGEFLIAANVQELRSIPEQGLQLLVNGTYKGVTLLGYYKKGDTPAEINYYISNTVEGDDGGSIFEVGDIKLEHKFLKEIDVRYFGVKAESGFDNSSLFDKSFNKGLTCKLVKYNEEDFEISTWITLKGSLYGVNNPTIKMTSIGGSDPNSCIRVSNYIGDSLIIDGLILKGNYDGGADGEWAHGIRLLGCKNITISNNTLVNNYGDSLYIGAGVVTGGQYLSENITIINNTLINPRRCNIGVIACKNVYIRGNNIQKTSTYVASIDLEPNKNAPLDLLENIYIEDNQFNTTDAYFVNLIDPVTRTHNNIFIKGNNGQARFFLRVTGGGSGKFNNIIIDNNTFTGEGRMFLVSANASKMTIVNNKDFATGADGWALNGQDGLIIQNNEIHYLLRTGIIFTDSTNIDISNNTFKELYRAIIFRGTSVLSTNNKINGNYFYDNSVAVRFETKVGSVSLDANFMSSKSYNVQAISEANGSDIRVLPSNFLLGVNFNGSQYFTKQFNSNNKEDTYGTTTAGKGYFLVGSKIWNTSPVLNGNIGWVCVQEGTATNSIWQANAVYNLGTQVRSGNNVYEVITAGTTSTTAPTGTNESIVDGSVVWKYISQVSIFQIFGYIGSIENATTTTKGLVNQAVSLPTTATNEEIITALKNAGLMAT